MNIGTYNEKPTAIIAGEIVQNNTNLTIQQDASKHSEESTVKTVEAGKIRFNDSIGNRIDLYRVIISLHKCGFFTDIHGNDTTMKDVFEEFGKMLGDDFHKFHKNLSEASKNDADSDAPIAIFERLKDAYLQYEKQKLNRK